MKVLIVDDQQMFREGIRSRLEQEADIEVVAEASSAEEALASIPEANPTIVLVDVRLRDTSGIELARVLRRDWPDLKILALTGYDFDQYVRAMARIGVEGYLLKDAPLDELVQALREVDGGGTVLPPRIASKVIKSFRSLSSEAQGIGTGELTLRELEVIELMYEGLRNAEIGDRLEISPRTVEAHVSSIISKLGVHTRAEAVRQAEQQGLIK